MKMDRRTWLGAASASASVAASVALAQDGDANIATGVIGVGNRGSYLLEAVLLQPGAKVAMVCDTKAERLDRAATVAGAAGVKDWRRVVESKDVQAVFIATPPHLHSEMAIAALRAGKHVYCEKPVGVTAAQVQALLEAAQGRKTVFAAGQQLRSMRQLGAAVAKIRGWAIGKVLWVKAQRHANADLAHDGSSGDWYFDVNQSGGYLIEQSVHNLDLCNWAVGAHPERACGFGATALYVDEPKGRTIFDCGTLSFEYPGGVKMAFTQNVFHPPGMPGGGQAVHVYGSKAAVDLLPGAMRYELGPEAKPSLLAEKVEEPRDAHITAFYDAIVKRTALPADLIVGAEAALTAILGHEAMTRARMVEWKEMGVDLESYR